MQLFNFSSEKNNFTRIIGYTYMTGFGLDIIEFLVKANTLPVIDVRSPAEFDHAHIPGAVNLPLFTNEERSVIGTLYLQKDSNEAMMKGLELIGPKMKDLALAGHRIAPQGEALMHCWRGGMRSDSMAWLMNTVGIKIHTLAGGYKSYRRYVHDYFGHTFKLVVIGGMTGSGKTSVLEALERRGEQVINLERLANHKGSVFGAIGMPAQPSTEQFENDLFTDLRRLDTKRRIFIEDESLAIGNVFIPRPFYDQMSTSDFIRLVVPFERRIESLLNEYATGDPAELKAGIRRIERRLGLENASKALAYIDDHEMKQAVEIVLKYYDKVYARSMRMHKRNSTAGINVTNESIEEIVNIFKGIGY